MFYIQGYFATFRLRFCSVTMSPNFFPDYSSTQRQSLMAADIAVRTFIVDVRRLVQDGVEGDTKSDVDGHDESAKQVALNRRKNLALWSKSKLPLSYDGDTYLWLIRAIIRPTEMFGLPEADGPHVSLQEIAERFYDMGKESPMGVQAPVVGKGTFMSVIHIGIQYMQDNMPQLEPQGKRRQIIRLLAVILKEHQVHHVPWSPNPSNGSGSSTRKVTWKVWKHTGGEKGNTEMGLTSLADEDEKLDILHRNIVSQRKLNDPTGEWSALDYTIGTLHKVLDKKQRPDDWKTQNAGLGTVMDAVVTGTYQWVDEHLNLHKPIHHLAIILAIMISKILPSVDKPRSPPASMGRGSEAVTQAVRDSPWSSNQSSRKGTSSPLPFLVMFSTYIIALAEADSPLRRNMATSQNSMGESWTSKHGRFFFLEMQSSFSQVQSGAKMINGFQLVRMGVATALSPSIWKSPKYGQAWQLKSIPELIIIHKHLTTLLKKKPGGAYDATVYVFGQEVADRIANDQGLIKTGSITRNVAAKRTAKRTHEEVDIIVIDDDDDPVMFPQEREPGSSSKRRK
jgi:hypothetical protein